MTRTMTTGTPPNQVEDVPRRLGDVPALLASEIIHEGQHVVGWWLRDRFDALRTRCLLPPEVAHDADGGGPGTSRVLSLRATSPDGPVRLSTAEVRWADGCATPAQEAEAALRGYLDDLASGRVAASSPDLPCIPGDDVVRGCCGYDCRAPGSWEATSAPWWPFLPRSAWGVSMADLAPTFTPTTEPRMRHRTLKGWWSSRTWRPGKGRGALRGIPS